MSLIDLQSWLLSEGIRNELDDLIKRMVVTEIDNLVPSADAGPTPEIDWSRLVLAGSILARSDQRSHQEAALRIATGAVTLSTSEVVKDAGAVLLGKLSNFRAIALAGERNLLATDLDGRLGMSLRIEVNAARWTRQFLSNRAGAGSRSTTSSNGSGSAPPIVAGSPRRRRPRRVKRFSSCNG